jgi:polyhydroxyalkanoate synthesis regulator phasin
MERTATAGADSSSAEGQAVSKAVTRAARRRAAAQASLFDLANQKVVDELREADPAELTPEEAKQLLSELRKRLL